MRRWMYFGASFGNEERKCMEIRVKQGSITDERVDLIIVNLFRDVTEPGGATGSVDAALGWRGSRRDRGG